VKEEKVKRRRVNHRRNKNISRLHTNSFKFIEPEDLGSGRRGLIAKWRGAYRKLMKCKVPLCCG
jgi:hypothetical protein